MIERIGIENLALIDEVHLELAPGLNVMTGETGAGKSIIVGAMDLLLGARASADLVRSGADKAIVEGLFLLPEGPAREALQTLDLAEEEPEVMLVRRVIPRRGKGRITVNGRLVTSSMLRTVTRHLVDMSSQHAHYALLDPKQHLDLLDRVGGLETFRETYSQVFGEVSALEREREELLAAERDRLEREDFLRFQLEEITSAEPEPGEDVAIESELKRLHNAEQLQSGLGAASDALTGEASSARQALAHAEKELRALVDADTELIPLLARLESARIEIEDLGEDLFRRGREVVHDPHRLAEADLRLGTLRRLLRKHGASLDDVLRRADEMAEELQRFASAEERIETLGAALIEKRKALLELGRALSKRRKKAAKALQQAVEVELAALGIERCALHIQPERYEEKPRSTGLDHVEFELAPNPGEGFLPLARCASGGELSRILLAIKAVMAQSDPVATSVYDEVDAGVGGGIAEIIGQKLKLASMGRQVLCITHLPQIAAYADHHLHVIKETGDERTAIAVTQLRGEERLLEIARMLGGLELTKTTRDHAEEMLSGGQAWAPSA